MKPFHVRQGDTITTMFGLFRSRIHILPLQKSAQVAGTTPKFDLADLPVSMHQLSVLVVAALSFLF
jgi:hypothetical protein